MTKGFYMENIKLIPLLLHGKDVQRGMIYGLRLAAVADADLKSRTLEKSYSAVGMLERSMKYE